MRVALIPPPETRHIARLGDRSLFPRLEARVSLEEVMRRSFGEVADMAQKYNVGLRVAAYMLGVARVADAIRARGIYA